MDAFELRILCHSLMLQNFKRPADDTSSMKPRPSHGSSSHARMTTTPIWFDIFSRSSSWVASFNWSQEKKRFGWLKADPKTRSIFGEWRASSVGICDWLTEYGYHDIVILIRDTEAAFAARGSRQRRNWWDVLAGRISGDSVTIEGRAFPVLASAQRRQGKPVTDNAIQRSPIEVVEPPRPTSRPSTGRTSI